MKYSKAKKTIFPLKVSDAFYSDLKYVAKSEGIPVSVFVRKHLEPFVEQRIKKLKRKTRTKKMTLEEFAAKYIWRGKTYYEDKTDDELLYGGKLGDD